MSGESQELLDQPHPHKYGPKEEPKKVACIPRELGADEEGLGITPQPGPEPRPCVNRESGTSVKGWPHGSQGCSPGPSQGGEGAAGMGEAVGEGRGRSVPP